MKKEIQTFVKKGMYNIDKHSPQILTGVGIVGMITCTALAVKATPKAIEILDEEKHIRSENHDNLPLKPVDYVKLTWKCYLPSIVLAATSTTCLIKANHIGTRRTAAAAAAYEVTKNALTSYKKNMVEVLGEEKSKEIKEAVAKDQIKQAKPTKEVVVIGDGDILMYDTITGREFESNIQSIQKAVNELNRQMISCMYVSLNEFYSEIGLKPTSLGDELGWNLDNGLVEIEFDSTITDRGKPAIVLSYLVAPRYDYSKLM